VYSDKSDKNPSRKEPAVKETVTRVSKEGPGCCNVVAVVTVDERGQMVLPKELRDRAGIKAGDRLAVVAIEKDSQLCCISLLRTEALSGLVREALKPVMKEVF